MALKIAKKIFKENWFVVLKMTRIWWILIRALKNLKKVHFNGLPLAKAYNVWDKKSIEEFCLKSLKIDATLDRKLTLAFKNDMRNLGNLHQSMSASLKIRTLMGYIYPKQKIYELKIYRGVLCHGNEEWCKIWREIDLSAQNLQEESDEVWPEHSKISKMCTLMGFFWTKYIMFELIKIQGSYVWWHWILMQHLKENWLVLS